MDAIKLKRLFFLSAIALFIASCSTPPCEKWLTSEPYSNQPQLLYLVKSPYSLFQLREYYVCLLRSHGVEVIRLGQTWKLIFPSDDLFINDTAEIRHKYKPLLNLAADFMRTYSKIAVKVAAFSNRNKDEFLTKFGTITDELTRQQADALVRYFTKREINARLIYGVGGGSDHPVAWNGTPIGRRLNRRAEVTFRYYRDSKAWI